MKKRKVNGKKGQDSIAETESTGLDLLAVGSNERVPDQVVIGG